MFLGDLAEKQQVEDAEFLVHGAPWLLASRFEIGMHFRRLY
jgi:hypothetical protein